MDGIKVDEFEKLEIEALIKQSIPETYRVQLNRMGYADYSWLTYDKQIEHVEHKTVHEILSKPGDVELQLQEQLTKCKKLSLLVEGVAESISSGTQTFELVDNGRYFRPSRRYNSTYERYEGFLLGLVNAGIPVWKVTSWIGVAQAIVSMYNNAQKQSHTTLQRYIVPSLPQFSPDIQVQALLGLCQGYRDLDLRIGPEIAIKLIRSFGTVWNLINADAEFVSNMVKGISVDRVKKLQKTIGKKI